MDYKKVASDVFEAVGGKDNITYVTHCITRLRFNLKDQGIPDADAIRGIEGVLGVQESAGQYQVIIGQHVGEAYDEVCNLMGVTPVQAPAAQGSGSKSKGSGIISSMLSTIIGTIAPLIPVLIGTGLGKCILTFVSMAGLANAETSMTFYVFNFVFDTGIMFLPVFTAVSAAKHFGCNQFLAALMGCALLHPSWTSMVSAADPKFIGDLFGIPLYGMSYASTLIPSILIVWVMSKLEALLEKYTPEILKSMVVPLGTLLIMTPLSFLVLAPSMGYVSVLLGNALLYLYDTFGGIAIAVLSFVYPWMVVTGTHSTLAIAGMQVLAQSGYDPFSRTLPLVANMAQGAAALACAVKTKSSQFRSVCLSTAFTVFADGVSEPVIYGVTLRLKRPMYAVMLGSAAGGLFAGMMALKAYTWMTPSLINLAMWVGDGGMSGLFIAIGTIVISAAVSFIATLVLGFEDPVDGEIEETMGALPTQK